MKRGRIPTYRLHRASGQAIVTLNGQDVYLGPHRSRVSRQEYDRVVGEWLARDRRLAVDEEKETTTVNEVILRYAEFARSYYVRDGKSTAEFSPIKQVLKVVRHLYGRTPAAQFGPLALKVCRERFLAAGQSRQKINQNMGRIRRMFKWAVENELVPPTVIQGLQAVAGLRMGRTEAKESQPVRPVPEEHIEAVLHHVAPVVSAMIRVHPLTGMRPGELVRMRGDEIDDSGTIWLYRPEKHKTAHHGHERVIHLGPRAQWILRPLLDEACGGIRVHNRVDTMEQQPAPCRKTVIDSAASAIERRDSSS